jgi:hypothetical protein
MVLLAQLTGTYLTSAPVGHKKLARAFPVYLEHHVSLFPFDRRARQGNSGSRITGNALNADFQIITIVRD